MTTQYGVRPSEAAKKTLKEIGELEGKKVSGILADLAEIVGRIRVEDWPRIRTYLQEEAIKAQAVKKE